MAEREKLGECVCPICKATGAEVLVTVTKFAYLKCGECVSMIRTQSRAGDRALRAMVTARETPPAPTPTPAPPPARKKAAHVLFNLGGDD